MHVDEKKNNIKPGLYCVATPIGNMGDITLRALEILKNSDLILCEDTRVSKKLLSKFKINKNLVSNHKFNENKNLSFVLEHLENGKIISIISDAGTPTISDPGRVLINKCVEKNINIYSIPGPSAVSAAISVSGFSDKYLFYGFLPQKKNEINKLFKSISNINYSIVFFISPKKIYKIFDLLKKYFFNRNILICREITKFHEEYLRSSIKNLSELSFSDKGEITVVISEVNNLKKNFIKLEESDKKKIRKLIKKMTIKNVINEFNKDNKFPKKIIYDYCLQIKNEKI